MRNYYLVNPFEQGERRFKLILSEADKSTLLAILQNTPMPDTASTRITENYQLFRKLILEHQDKLEAICKGLSKLVIVDVSLDRTQDNPQLIFESLNSTGLELSQADQIRNYILMGLEPNLQTELYTTYWRPMEKAFGQGAYVVHFDAFMRHYLTAKTGDIPNVREVYAVFKTFARAQKGNTRDLVADIHAYALYYCALALDTEKDVALKQAFHDLRELKVDVAYRPASGKSGQQYGLVDHPHLASGSMHELFEALRQAVLALDPCVSEEFLKLYVAYKAETNFVDVVPQAKRLVLVLNLSIEDIEDPKSLCRDIANVGRWGNGDVEIGISNLHELPYAMGMIRQSFDHQMGSGMDVN